MTNMEIRNSLYEVIKKDYESFVETVKKNNNYDFFRSLDNFAQRVAFLKSNKSHGLNFYRNYIYKFIYGDGFRIFSFDAYDRATKIGYYHTSKTPEQLLLENKILMYVDNSTQEEILEKTVYKDFRKRIEKCVKDEVADLICEVMFGREY